MTDAADGTAPIRFGRHPMLMLAGCFAAGILAAEFARVDWHVLMVICAAAAVGAWLFQTRPAATALIFVAFAAAGMASSHTEKASVRADRIKVYYDSGAIASVSPVEVEGVLAGRPEPAVDGQFLMLRTENLWYRGEERPSSGNVRVFVADPEISNLRSDISNLKYGSRVRVACRLEREDEFLNPGVLRRTEILDRLGIDATCTVKSPLLIEHIADESVLLPLAWVYDQRAKLIDAFRNNLAPSAAGVMVASLLGDKYFLDKDTADLFREGGTFHILIISGLHITFIGGLLLLLVRRLTGDRWLQFIVTTGVLWAYTLAVGADVPVVRASIMFTVVLSAYAIYRHSNLLNSLGLCGLVVLVWRPSDLFNPSFQLTFLSVAAIVACAYPLIKTLRAIGTWTPTASHPFPPNVPDWLRRLCETIYWNKDAWNIDAKRQIWTAKLFKSPLRGERGIGVIRSAIRYVFDAAVVSVIVQLWMLPLTVVYFHRVSISGVVLNIWVGFFIALESFAAVIGALAGSLADIFGRPFFMFADGFNWMMLLVPRLFSDSNWASFRLSAYSHAGAAFYIAYIPLLLFFAFALNAWRPFAVGTSPSALTKRPILIAGSLFTVLLIVIVFHPFSAPRPDGRLHVDFLDVGQGDSLLVTFPDGETLLVDGGGRFDYRKTDDDAEEFQRDTRTVGESVVSEFLWHRGYASLDHILATHADADHMEGLGDVAKNFRIGSALFGRMPKSDADFAELAAVLDRRRIPIESVSWGERFKFGDAIVEVLYPRVTDDLNAPSDNEHSVVMRIVYGSRAFLLTGDIEQEAEQTLLSNGGTLRADVVKAPHHGSRTSSTQAFIDAVGAKYAVISVGRSSPFGHPHAEVVERWRASGAEVMTTGERGMISFSTDGRDLIIER